MPVAQSQFEAIASAAAICAASPKDDYALLALMRAINAVRDLYTDDMFDAICDLAREYGEDADGDLSEDAIWAAKERGYPGNRIMRDAMREWAA